MAEEKIYTVSELSNGIKYLLETSFASFWIEGEISGAKKSSLGHVYFDLKDASSNLACVIFKHSCMGVKFEPENGMLVQAKGKITNYAKQSKYQLIITDMKQAGLGPLQIAFEKLKKKLADEGLFDQARKRPIPPLPQKIGIVTSPTGAAIRDILSVLKRRYADLHIIIAPAKVQGEGAADEIADAVKYLNDNFPETDVLLVGRGGGSAEDLWCFNEEKVARAIAGSKIPVISCVGHEIDFTIADFAADLRAPTPSAAAELVVKNKEDLIQKIKGLEKRLLQGLRVYYEHSYGRLKRLTESRIMQNPLTLLETPTRRLDEASENLFRAADEKERALREKLTLLTEKIKALSPLSPLKKGYALVRKTDGRPVRTSSELSDGEIVSIHFSEGEKKAEIIGDNIPVRTKERRTGGVKSRQTKDKKDSRQDDLWQKE